MHGGLLEKDPFPLDLRWNDFNEYYSGTKLLHYTYENQQPWYEPWHSLSCLWEAELVKAIAGGYVSFNLLKESLELGKKGSIDWRAHGGLHPHYEKYLEFTERF